MRDYGLLAIDPSMDPNKEGWAFFVDGTLQRCGLYCDMESSLYGLTDFVVIECPMIYPRTKVDPNDILVLAIRVGIHIGSAQAAGVDYRLVRPREWKGTVPKAVFAKRILSKLTASEGRILWSLDHNIVDAIGLGLYHLGRLGQ